MRQTIANHIIQGPHVRLANPASNVAANPVHKSGGCYPVVVVLQYWNLLGSQIRFTNLVRNVAANPIRRPGGCYLTEVAPRIADKIHCISPLPKMTIY